MVGHFELAERFPRYYIKKEFGRDEYPGEIQKRGAVHLDLEGRTYQILPR